MEKILFEFRKHCVFSLCISLVAMFFATALSTANAQSRLVSKQEFPRLGGMQIGLSRYADGVGDPEYQAEIAKLDYAVINRADPNLTEFAKQIKALNPNIVLAKYQNIAETRLNDNFYNTPMREKLDSEQGPNNTNAHDWWLRDADGNRLELWPETYRVNVSEYVKPDANGDRWPQWRARYEYDLNMKDPVWDGWYMDLTTWEPKWKGGPEGDFSGGKVSSEEHNRAYRRAHRAYWEEIRRLTPGRLILVNHNWYDFDQDGKLQLGEYAGANGGYLEYKMNYANNAREWTKIYRWYRLSMSYFVEPKFVLFDAQGPATNYQFFRYAFATALMADGYFEYSPDDEYMKGSVLWYDEFDLAGTSDTRWMGRPVSGSPDSPWRSGVYRRDFENAVVLVNPMQNGRVTVTVESGLRKIAGRQDPKVNDGRAATNITLEAGDGIILVRNSSVDADSKRPKPPTLMSE